MRRLWWIFPGRPSSIRTSRTISISCGEGLSYVKSSGGTAVYDALVASADYLAKNAKRSETGVAGSNGWRGQCFQRRLWSRRFAGSRISDGPVIYSVWPLFGQDTDKRESRACKACAGDAERADGRGGVFSAVAEGRGLDCRAGGAAIYGRSTRLPYHSTKSPTLGGYRQVRVEAKAKEHGQVVGANADRLLSAA